MIFLERYNEDQHFLVITMEDGGTDLEKFKFKNMRQVQSIVKQLVNSLALAEEHIQFEHRDLHLGNILVKETEIARFIDGNDTFTFDGISCSIIDYSLSRMRDTAGVAYRDLESIDWLFEGDSSVDSQYQVYKDMRINKGSASWKEFRPRSNILWLEFILERLVQSQKKSIQTPKGLFTALSGLHKRVLNYSSVRELKLKDNFFNTNQ
jgi:serine/threonine-protein kinase haspin